MPWQTQEPLGSRPADTADFLETLNTNQSFFDPTQPLVVARAPGRLDLMGGIADYSGSLVLELPLGVAVFAAAQADASPTLTIRSLQASGLDVEADVTLALADLAPNGIALEYSAARAFFSADPRTQWAAYVAGTLIVLGRERGLMIDRGMRLLIGSRVPPGKGVSSSAALEVATMQAVTAVYGIELDGRELAILCQMVENLVVGAPCGIMDQMTSACGIQDSLLALLCQPAELEAPVALPPELEVWGVDSGIRHAVSGADYGSVRIGAFMGYRMIAEQVGFKHQPQAPGARYIQIDDPRWYGFLANITPSEWEQHYRQALPEHSMGDEFLARYSGTTDRVTQVDPARRYAVRQPAAHPIYEHHRVRLFRTLLLSGATDEEQRRLLGELMFQSHASYSACGLGSDGTDALVELVRAAGPAQGLYGAKITGGGSGGTVAILGRRGAQASVHAIARQYEQQSGRNTTFLSGSSPGAKAFGVIHIIWHT